MTEKQNHEEQLLIDFVLGRCEPAQTEAVRRRLETDEAFRARHQDIRNALAAMELLPPAEPPAGLAERTINRLRQIRTTEALIARAELDRQVVSRPRFSLRDLTAVASVLLIVGLALYMTLGRGYLGKLRDERLAALCEARLADIGKAIHAYAGDNAGLLPVSAPVAGPWLAGPNRQAISNSTALFNLVRMDYAPAENFQCPGIAGPTPRRLVMKAGMTDFPQGEYIGYSYQHTLGRDLSTEDPVLQAAAAEMAILADSNPLFAGGQFHPQRVSSAVSDNHNGRGQNVLYLDGRVAWAKTPAAGVGGNNIYLAEGILDYQGNEAPTGPTDTFLLPTFSRN